MDLLSRFESFILNYNLEKRVGSLSLNVDILNEEEPVIDLDFLAKDNKLHLFAQELFQKPLGFDFNTDMFISEDNLSLDDYLYIYNLLIEKTILNLEKDDFKQEKGSITINNEEIKTNRITLELDYLKIGDLANKVVDDLRKDERAYSILDKIFDDFEYLYIDENDLDINVKYLYSIHTTGILKKVVGIDIDVIVDLSNDELSEEKEEIYCLQYRSEELDSYYYKDGDNSYKLTLEKTRNYYKAVLYKDNTKEIASITLQIEGTDRLNIDAELHIDDYIYSLAYKTIITRVTDGREYKISNTLSLSYSGVGESGTATLSVDMILKLIAGIDLDIKFDLAETVSYENLTEEELTEINENFNRITFDELLGMDFINQTKCAASFNCNCNILPNECICNYMDEEGEIDTVNCPNR